MSRILIIDDEKTILDNLKFILDLEGYEVILASSGFEGIDCFMTDPNIDVIVSDMKMPGLSGLDVIKAIRQRDQDIGIIVLTGNGEMENAVQAMREGAYDYLNKPVHADKLILSIENAIRKLQLIKENRQLTEDILKKNLYFQNINEAAQQILLNMAPGKDLKIEGLNLFSIYQCCDHVGGDMYDVFEIGDKILFYIFDVCGHGILSAVMTMVLKSSFSNLKFLYDKSGIIPEIEEIVQYISQEMYNNTASNLFATLFTGIYEKKTQEMTYISAGHVDQYLLSGEELKTLSSTGTVIGIFQDEHYQSERIKIHPSDKLFLFTDGITEIWHDEIIITTDEIMRIIDMSKNNPLDETVSTIYNNLVLLYENKKPDDDITLMGIEFLSPEVDFK